MIYLANWKFEIAEDPFRKHVIKVECRYKLTDGSFHYYWTLINPVLQNDQGAVHFFAQQVIRVIKRDINKYKASKTTDI